MSQIYEHTLSKCPKCGALPEAPCITEFGREADKVHYGRPEWSKRTKAYARLHPDPSQLSEVPEVKTTNGMRILCDIETYSSTDLKSAGVYRYREDPTFQVLMAAWSVDGGPVELTVGHAESMDRFYDYLIEGNKFVAHNAQFERVCLGGPIHIWDDTMARAGEHGYPQALGKLAAALGAEEKDSAGTSLINFFCRPNRRGQRNLPEDHPEKWEQFKAYCIQDVATLIDVDKRLPGWPGSERRVWEVDQAINDRGVRVDLELAEAAVAAAEDNQLIHELEIMSLSGIDNPASNPQLMKWLDGCVPNLQAEVVQAALDGTALRPDQRRVLELRQELAGTASKKYTAFLNRATTDGRLHGEFRFFGAHTGRWAARGAQLHNFPRASLKSDSEVDAAILDLKMGLGAEAYTLKALVRPSLVGPLTVVDYAAIEARVIAWLANESWALEAFRAGRDIYVETAERMGGLTRAQGKIAVLALGFAGGLGSLRAMGGDALGSEETLQMIVQQWRRANPSIVKLWDQLETAFRTGGPAGPRLRVTGKGQMRQVQLPSGRAITYHGVRWERYWVVDPKTKETIEKEGWRYDDAKGYRVGTYGGRLVENATQAVARDILAAALVRLESRGYRVVGHVHDEILIEGEHDVAEVTRIMCEDPGWADGLPIDGEGFVCGRYRKG